VGRYSYYIHSATKHYGSSPNFLHADRIPGSGFTSLYAVTEDTAKAIVEAATTAGFKGAVGDETDTLWIDTDSEEAGRKVAERIKEMGYAHCVYHSGGRGLHIGIHRVAKPSHLLPLQDRTWVEEHFSGLADTSIYTHLHLFRLPGTRHERTGLEKRPLYFSEGRDLTLPRFQRGSVPETREYSESEGNPLFLSQRVMANVLPHPEGERHPTLVRLAYALRDDVKAPPDAALWLLQEANRGFSAPKSEAQVEQIFRSIFAGRK
jgi:hypothetical protein